MIRRSSALLLLTPAIGAPIPFVDFNGLALPLQIGWVVTIPVLFFAGCYLWVREGK